MTKNTIIEGHAVWLYGLNSVRFHASEISICVKAKGQIVDQTIADKMNGWRYQFCLPRYDSYGKEIVYQLCTTQVAGYEPQVKGSQITYVHSSVILDADGVPTGKFQSDQREYNMYCFQPQAAFFGAGEKIWFIRKSDG